MTLRRILARSRNMEIRKLYALTSPNHVPLDSIINKVISNRNESSTEKQIKSRIDGKQRNVFLNSKWNNFMALNEQYVLVSHLVSECSVKSITTWQILQKRLPSNIFAFCRKALNKANLLRWKISSGGKCTFCGKLETQLHILSNCVSYLERYKWRHNSILRCLSHFFEKLVNNGWNVFVDCEKLPNKCSSELFETQRPDIVFVKGEEMVVVELTCCFETNTGRSRQYKQKRYKNLRSQLLKVPCSNFRVLFLEITTLGFIGKQSLCHFTKFCKEVKIDSDRAIYKCMETAVRATYCIFCRRNKAWTDPELLLFV